MNGVHLHAQTASVEGGGGDEAVPILRAGGVVLRHVASDGLGADAPLEVLLVSRRKKPGSYTVPAGKFEEEVDGGSFEACALRETIEEAGVECEILFDLGCYISVSKDGSRRRTHFFAMRLLQESVAWTEASERMRCWFPVGEAQQLVEHSELLKELFQKVSCTLAELSELVFTRVDKPLQDLRGRVLSEQIRLGSMSSDDSEAKTGRRKQAKVQVQAADAEAIGQGTPMKIASAEEDGDDSSLFGGLIEEPDGPAPEPSQASSPKPADLGTQSSGVPARKTSFEELAQVHIEDLDGERFCFYKHQVGGHFCFVKPAPESHHITVKPPRSHGLSVGQVQVSANGVVLKPLEEHEHSFYEDMLCAFPAFAVFAPRMFGTKTLSLRQVSAMTANVGRTADESFLGERMRSHQFQQYIVMQDLASSMIRPRILDLKMGFKQRSKRHSTRKKESCKSKALNSTSHAIGFRICGIHMEEFSHDKYWGRNLPLAEIRGALSSFFLHSRASDEERSRLVTQLIERLQALHDTVASMLGWRFWNTSLLFLHDGAAPGSLADCRLIDFAHCTRVKSSTPDDEFLFSVKNLQVFLEALRDDHPQDPWIAERLCPHPSGGARQDAEELESEAESDVAEATFEGLEAA